MREIKFRGKSLKTGEWIYGQYILNPANDKAFIVKGWLPLQGWHITEIDPKTLGQYIGLHDKNSVEIYEKDVMKLGAISRQYFEVKVNDFHGYRFYLGEEAITRADAEYGEVIGNVTEHPELLEASESDN